MDKNIEIANELNNYLNEFIDLEKFRELVFMSKIELSDTDIEKSMFLNFENFLKLLLEKGETKESILKLSEIEKRIFDENNFIKKEIIRIENHLKNIEDSKNNPVYHSYVDYLNKLKSKL